jgi:hypothetical protein
MLERLGRLYLLLDAFGRLESLPAELQEEVRTQVGWSQDQDALLKVEGVRDLWAIVGQRETEEDRLRVRRTWLWGIENRRSALVLDFAAPGQTLEGGGAPGILVDGELVFWNSPYPQRAIFKNRGISRPLDRLPGYPGVPAALAAYGAAVAVNPWLDRFLFLLEEVRPVLQGSTWWVCDRENARLPLSTVPQEGWRLMGMSGGRPCALAGEWDGEKLAPLGVWAEGAFTVFRNA